MLDLFQVLLLIFLSFNKLDYFITELDYGFHQAL